MNRGNGPPENSRNAAIAQILVSAGFFLTIVFFGLAIYTLLANVVGMAFHGFVPAVAQIALFSFACVIAYISIHRTEKLLGIRFRTKAKDWVVIAVCCFIVFRRTYWSVYDLFTPTDLIGGVARASNGMIPFSFANFPEFYANYHAHFIVASSILRTVLGISVIHAILLCYMIGTATFVSFVIQYLKFKFQLGYFARIVFLILLLIASSFPLTLDFDGGSIRKAEEYVMISDIILSNSWAFGLSMLLLLPAAIEFQKNDVRFALAFWVTCIFFLLTISVNGSVFSFGLIAWSSWALINVYSLGWRRVASVLAACAALFLISQQIPSVNLSGAPYTHPAIAFRAMSSIFGPSVAWHIQLVGPLSLIAFAILFYEVLRRGVKAVIDWTPFDIFFVIALTFPILFSTTGISEWDAVHKNSVMSIFLSLFVLASRREKLSFLNGKYLISVYAVIAIVTAPNIVDFFRRTTRDECSWCKFDSIEKGPEVAVLKEFRTSVMYPIDRVSLDTHSFQNSLAGHFTKNSIYPGFLLWINQDEWPRSDRFRDVEWLKNYIKKQKLPGLIQLPQESSAEFTQWFKANAGQFQFNLDWNDGKKVGQYFYIPIVWP
ncbi:MAG: hypothetical protein JWP38_1804 [Herbaspirillum sp.]|nr:hypothetical protein [Herbaspirillum sp.]